jgi:Rrf2 family protein
MRLSARVDYALRAVVELASATAGAGTSAASGRSGAESAVKRPEPGAAGRPVTAERLAQAQQIPPKFLESILLQLRRAGIVTAQRGPEGGYRLARPADEISLAEVIRVIDGPLANVRGHRPEELGYHGAAVALQEVWIALRASEREILDMVTLADVVTGDLPERVRKLAANPRAWT